MDWRQLWDICSAPDNIPIVALIPLLAFYLLSGMEAGEGQRRPDCGARNQSRDGEDSPSQDLAVRAGVAERSTRVAVPAAH